MKNPAKFLAAFVSLQHQLRLKAKNHLMFIMAHILKILRQIQKTRHLAA